MADHEVVHPDLDVRDIPRHPKMKHLTMEWVGLWPNESSLFLILPRSTQVMKTFLASVVILLVFGGVMADLTVLMYTDSSFESYVGQVQFDSTDRCYPLCSDTEAVAAFVWDVEPHGTQLVVFEDFECRGRFVTGERSTEAKFAAIAARHKVRSFILSTTKSFEATRGIVHSCEEKSDLVYKPFNDTAVWM